MYPNEKNNDGKIQNLQDEEFIDLNFTMLKKCNSLIKNSIIEDNK